MTGFVVKESREGVRRQDVVAIIQVRIIHEDLCEGREEGKRGGFSW